MNDDEPEAVEARLSALRGLQPGWLDGQNGWPPSWEVIDWLRRVLQARYPSQLDQPWLFPTPEGGIQAEWCFGFSEVTLDIQPQAVTGTLHALDLTTDSDDAEIIRLDTDEAWDALFCRLKQLMFAACNE